MSFNIALSGINAAQKDIDVTANNISNVATYGFKESRAEFADVYSASVFTNAKTATGQGVTTADVAQQFNQGSFLFTNNSLDMAIDGSGFYATTANQEDTDVSLTRAGAWKLDSESYVVNSAGEFLRAFPVNSDGSVASVSLATTEPLQIPSTAGSPQATANVDISVNLAASDTPLEPSLFDPTDSSTYNSATSLSAFDSLGQSYIMTTYYVKDATAPTGTNRWANFFTIVDQAGNQQEVDVSTAQPSLVYTDPITGLPIQDPAPRGLGGGGAGTGVVGIYMQYNPDGTVITPDGINGGIDIITEELGSPGVPGDQLGSGADMGGADPTQTITFNYNNPTQFASPFEVTQLTQDGVQVGRLVGIDIGPDGLVAATFSNGTNEFLGKIALVKVANEQGLTPIGNTSWKASQASGDPIAGEADQGSFGRILSGTLEQSNVNLTTELVDLITAQRNFQANSRSLEVNNTVTQTILQIR